MRLFQIEILNKIHTTFFPLMFKYEKQTEVFDKKEKP